MLGAEMISYPNNLNLADIYYFMLAPTMCYELNFPRTKAVRWRFLAKRLTEASLLLVINVSIIQQWIQPTVGEHAHRSTVHPANYGSKDAMGGWGAAEHHPPIGSHQRAPE